MVPKLKEYLACLLQLNSQTISIDIKRNYRKPYKNKCAYILADNRRSVKNMGVFNKLGQAFGSSKEINIEEYMNSVEMDDVDMMHEPADMYIKPVSITSEDEVKAIEEEIAKKNIILLDITELNKRPNTRTNVVAELKKYVDSVNGDIGQIDASRILITPSKVKIIKRKKPMQK